MAMVLSNFLQGIALVGAGTIAVFQSIQTYVIDSFALHAASGEVKSRHRWPPCSHPLDYRSSRGCCVLALSGRLRFPVVRSCNVQST
jgi:hypothetical protein